MRLLPDDEVRIDSFEVECQPNSSLGIPMDRDLRIDAVEVRGDVGIIRVEGTFKGLRLGRFYSVSTVWTPPRETDAQESEPNTSRHG